MYKGTVNHLGTHVCLIKKKNEYQRYKHYFQFSFLYLLKLD